jgi:hypothetical protein
MFCFHSLASGHSGLFTAVSAQRFILAVPSPLISSWSLQLDRVFSELHLSAQQGVDLFFSLPDSRAQLELAWICCAIHRACQFSSRFAGAGSQRLFWFLAATSKIFVCQFYSLTLVSRGFQLVSLPLMRGVADLVFCSAPFSAL